MLFWTDKPESNGPKVEAKVRKELGAAAPIPYQVQVQGQYRPQSAGQFASELAGDAIFELFGVGGIRPLYTFDFRVDSPRPIMLQVPVVKAGNAIVLGSLLYSTPLSKPVGGEVVLEDEKIFGNAKFVGDEATIGKLNANKDLVKRVNKFARTEYQVGNEIIRAKRLVKITPHAPQSVLTINTQPRSTWFGLGSSFDVQPFLELVQVLESTL
jgi:hypothetical protein